MLKTIEVPVETADTLLKGDDKKAYVIFAKSRASFYRNCGISFSLRSGSYDAQELDLLFEIMGVYGDGWQSQLVGRRARLIIDIKELDRSDVRIKVKAIGHQQEEDGDDDYFLVLNSRKQLVSHETAMKMITEEMEGENN